MHYFYTFSPLLRSSQTNSFNDPTYELPLSFSRDLNTSASQLHYVKSSNMTKNMKKRPANNANFYFPMTLLKSEFLMIVQSVFSKVKKGYEKPFVINKLF